ncbi:MAG: Asp-tRNA(Asn)/Glu-tRNA(Gln) amidotransferase subunit GatB [Desulfovibrionaceae bacterium]|nr:Asp-tRNA(Asn)/Glu-tRNA(Gln) amidotransferase subunit GatB [Desulfovibrionaceae bacterium]
MPIYETVIGLEVHVHLSTKTKLFCSCPTTFGSEPNTNVCEICAGMPGVLPVLNRTAVEYAARAGMALNCTINNDSVFARKNYFYPDMPFNYQISQFERPLCEHGWLEIATGREKKRIGITRIHMETDAGKSIHSPSENKSCLDLNRAAVPLIEIVSEPDMRSPEEAAAYLKELHDIVVYLGITDGNMEEGSFRCDANVSIRPVGSDKLGTRTELKNLNSFRNVQRAIEYEVIRQQDLLEDGEAVIQQTRLYDSVRNVTQAMRDKEEAQDYRYFPDPDLVPVHIDPADLQHWKDTLPELPAARRERFMREYGLPEDDAVLLTSERALAEYLDQAVAAAPNIDPRKIANLMTGPLLRELNRTGASVQDTAMNPKALAQLAEIVQNGLISAKIAQDIFPDLCASGEMPEAYVKAKGMVQVSDTSAIDAAVAEVLKNNPAEVAAFKGGKTKLQGFFVGQVMRLMKGKANPALVNKALAEQLSK